MVEQSVGCCLRLGMALANEMEGSIVHRFESIKAHEMLGCLLNKPVDNDQLPGGMSVD